MQVPLQQTRWCLCCSTVSSLNIDQLLAAVAVVDVSCAAEVHTRHPRPPLPVTWHPLTTQTVLLYFRSGQSLVDGASGCSLDSGLCPGLGGAG